ncbi:MAG: cupin domain-containing protein [Candidatus Thorarchaeota archaeon]
MVSEFYPPIISSLPEAKIPLEGIKGWIAQGETFQIVFFDISSIGRLPPHSHAAQFGVVLEGEMTLTVSEVSKRYVKGDTYYIPDGVVHSAEFHTPVKAMDFFAEPSRYHTK